MLTFHILNVYVDKTQPRQFKFTFNAFLNLILCYSRDGAKSLFHSLDRVKFNLFILQSWVTGINIHLFLKP